MRVTAWHNIATDHQGRLIGMLEGYHPGHPLVAVATWDVPDGTGTEAAMEDAFAVLNVGEDPWFGPPDARAVTYRARRNRSQSTGDVIQAGITWAAVAPIGFTPIPAPEHLAAGASRPGTTSLPTSDS